MEAPSVSCLFREAAEKAEVQILFTCFS